MLCNNVVSLWGITAFFYAESLSCACNNGISLGNHRFSRGVGAQSSRMMTVVSFLLLFSLQGAVHADGKLLYGVDVAL